jgi:hypothetical protein
MSYLKREIAERLALTELLRIRKDFDLVFTPLQSNLQFDGYITSASTVFKTECKVRNHFTSDFKDWIIEKIKYDALKNENSIYINFLKDKILIWFLNNINEPEWNETILPANSIDTDAEHKLKANGLLSIDDAMVIEWNGWDEVIEKTNEMYARRKC